MVIFIWNGSKVFHTVSNVIKLWCQEVQSRNVNILLRVSCPGEVWNISQMWMMWIEATNTGLLGMYLPMFTIYKNDIRRIYW